ncbi:ROK family transcriptional regulator [Actinospica robiniae]|uniref:ROK family transcriptional regulator n=1 Tax=Actinospica robiniae TaxID=304901 RepID=UPI0004297E4F|nr:ROK family transcriptional regulator [Actinospica robiniae]
MTSTRIADSAPAQPWSSRTLRVNNERVLLERLRASGATSRAELARVTGISKPTVSAALGNLERAGLVRETGEMATASGRGRSAVLYEVNPTAGYVVGIDIGRSRIRVALADLDGTLRGRREVPTAIEEARPADASTADSIVATASGLAREVVAEAGLEWDRVVHTVVGTPGVFNPDTDEVRYAGSLPGWGRAGVVERLRSELGTSLAVHNDANLAALGEYAFGAGRGCPLLVFLMVGTGVGAGIVVNGEVFGGAHGAAGEVGYLPFPPGQNLDGPTGRAARKDSDPAEAEAPHNAFLQRGMLDAAAGGSAVVHLAATAGSREAGSPKAVFDAARAGDTAALTAVRAEAARLAHAVASIAAMLDPALVILGGGIGDNADLLLDPLYDALETLTPLRPPVVAAALGGDAVLLGAIATALTTAREYVFEGRRL